MPKSLVRVGDAALSMTALILKLQHKTIAWCNGSTTDFDSVSNCSNQFVITMKLFLTSYFQIGLVVLNTILIQKGYLIGVFLASFTISILWCYNVSKVSVSSLKSKVVYSLGSGFGAISAYFFMKLFG